MLRGLRASLSTASILAALALVVGGSYFAYGWATHSPRFAISEISISGNRVITKADIDSLLELPSDANVFRTDVTVLEQRLTQSPWIRSAEVSRDLPAGLAIVIHEESAKLAIELSGLYLVNAEGTIFKRASVAAGEIDGLSIVTGLTRKGVQHDLEGSQSQLLQAIYALAEFESNSERPRIGEIHLDKRHGASFITYDDAIAIHVGALGKKHIGHSFRLFDAAWQALDSEERAAVRSFRMAENTPSDRVTVAFAEN